MSIGHHKASSDVISTMQPGNAGLLMRKVLIPPPPHSKQITVADTGNKMSRLAKLDKTKINTHGYLYPRLAGLLFYMLF
jgi:hypothetical protein